MEIQKQLQKIKAGKWDPVYLLLGQENYLVDRFRETLVDSVLAGDVNAFNFVHFDLQEQALSDAMLEANTISFFQETRIIWLSHPSFLTGDKGKGAVKQDPDELLAYLDHPAEEVVLVIEAPYEKLDNRKKVVKQLKKAASLVDVGEMKPDQVARYVEGYISQLDQAMDRDAVKLFLERTNYKLSRTMDEMAKLQLFTADADRITAQDVRLLVEPSIDDDIFHLTDYLMRGQADPALSLYRQLIADKQSPIAILALLMSNFRLYCQINQFQRMGYDQGSMAKALSAHPYRIKMAGKQAAAYPGDRLIQAYLALVDLDFRIKTGRVDQNLGIEWFILRFCG
ncbi:DNA polymerase III subunit delta [Aerococcus sanguinicola]|uniref:DNA polymerase III subunit delta n=1 Tax=unclassified Aerococcus TaxID=2618060 RepID=UPI0008A357C6|nr:MULTISPECIES: DNA polymerase III subunit delta [unclassified Aerococcus]KAB0647867.1 DNA polymerase III subunit delta [Aerococcus sanguinicola]MDK6234206.1 DNA polymerase III subunit delta [Aerococcus sp. UMB10185]MDK6856623.1 DNA polymerase III subunit delta [Aerococcus sp. UMB7533]MDK8503221.1 DNA polymerase III subunit delta [Aerococcus sp. UMB1112A]OFN01740.1 DNA polymerase III subunit delta [Aerococcus sp. HMSC062A02]